MKTGGQKYYWNHEGWRYSIYPTHTIATDIIETNYQGSRSKLPLLNEREKFLSDQSQLKIKKIINLLLHCSRFKWVYARDTKKMFKFKINFCTLTLPSKQIHGDREIVKKILEPFLRIMRDRYSMGEYIWKAEVQDNDNLHFHLTTNIFIHYRKLRYEWNKCCEKLGYVTRGKVEDPNSTDVHSVQNIKNLAGYLCGYMSKKDEWKKVGGYLKERESLPEWIDSFESPVESHSNIGRKRIIRCRLWDCSTNLKGDKCLRLIYIHEKGVFENGVTTEELNKVGIDLAETAERYQDKDFYQLIFHNKQKWENSKHLKKKWKEFIDSIRKKECQKSKYEVDSL